MKKEFWLVLFIIALCVDIGFILSDQSSLRLLSKPMIVVSLLIYFISSTSGNLRLRYLIIKALSFSLLGDILLLFESDSPMFFIAGLLAFLLAHIFYIIAFHFLWIKDHRKFRLLPVVPVLIYYFLLIFNLYNYLGDLKLPVIVYGLTISVMLAMAIQLTGIKHRLFGQFVFLGALLFIISDSVLAFSKFYKQWNGGSLMIMLSYGLAQLFITYGMSRIIEADKQGETIFVHPEKA